MALNKYLAHSEFMIRSVQAKVTLAAIAKYTAANMTKAEALALVRSNLGGPALVASSTVKNLLQFGLLMQKFPKVAFLKNVSFFKFCSHIKQFVKEMAQFKKDDPVSFKTTWTLM